MKLFSCRKGLSLLEILVSMIIFSVALVGLVNIFIISKQYVLHSRFRMSASQAAKFFFTGTNQLVVSFANATNSNTCLYNNALCTAENITLDGKTYSATYTTSDIATASPELRKVMVNISWNETEL